MSSDFSFDVKSVGKLEKKLFVSCTKNHSSTAIIIRKTAPQKGDGIKRNSEEETRRWWHGTEV